jgi:hypothetical protein
MKNAKKREDNKVEYGTVSLPLPIIEKIKERISGTGMPSVSSYTAFVLREILSSPTSEGYKKNIEKVKDKLDALGYS